MCLEKAFWKKICGLKLPGKVINLIWRACRQVLPTADALRKKYVDISSTCSWCQGMVEDDVHILFRCCFAEDVWTRMKLTDLVYVTLNDSVMTILKRVFQNVNRDQIGMVGMVCWNLWQRRNDWVWNRVNTSSFSIQSRAVSMTVEWNRAGRKWCRILIEVQLVVECGVNHLMVG